VIWGSDAVGTRSTSWGDEAVIWGSTDDINAANVAWKTPPQ
jgi:hypothetical protein